MSDIIQAATISLNGSITIIYGDKSYIIQTDHKHYKDILECVKSNNIVGTLNYCNMSEKIENYLDDASGNLTLEAGQFKFNGHTIVNGLTHHILSFMDKGFPTKPLFNYAERVFNNPDSLVIEDLHSFAEHNNMPITEDGYILAYKRVTEDYRDYFSGKIDNRVGQKPWMPRFMVCKSREECYGPGFHFCSLQYLSGWHKGDGRIIIVKIDPADVVSFPEGESYSKGRCNTYEVIGEYNMEEFKKLEEGEHKLGDGLYGERGEKYEPEEIENAKDEDDWDEADLCDGCGEYVDECTCNDKEDADFPDTSRLLDDSYGRKPDGSRFYNQRDEKGHFVKRS